MCAASVDREFARALTSGGEALAAECSTGDHDQWLNGSRL
jgi:hypothetical protein